QSLLRNRRERKPKRAARSRFHGIFRCLPLRLEQLEDRTLLTTVSWDGGAGTLRWDDAQNWSNDALPGNSDDAVIGSAFSGLTITHDIGDVSVRSLTSAAAIQVAGGTFALGSATSQIDDAFTVSGGSLLLSSATLNGPGTLSNAAGRTLTLTSSTINAALVNQGAIVIRAGDSINGSFTTTADSTLTVQGDGF